ncbi:MAG: hypothetical protein ACRDSE_14675 [Pseudonocardiaceae bacterium]
MSGFRTVIAASLGAVAAGAAATAIAGAFAVDGAGASLRVDGGVLQVFVFDGPTAGPMKTGVPSTVPPRTPKSADKPPESIPPAQATTTRRPPGATGTPRTPAFTWSTTSTEPDQQPGEDNQIDTPEDGHTTTESENPTQTPEPG